MIPQGLQDANFYELIKGSLMYSDNAYGSLSDFFRLEPNYWQDEKSWQTIYALASYENPTRTFAQMIGSESVPIMATYLADDAETPLITDQGLEKQTGDIPRMGQGHFFSTKTYDDARKFSRTVGELYNRVYDAFVIDTAKLIKGVHAQRSFTGYRIESTGEYVSTKLNNSGGIENMKISVHPLASNTKKCGGFGFGTHNKGAKEAWSSASAKPLGDLEDMFYYSWNSRILSADPAKAVFRMSRTAYDLLCGHTDTKTKVAMWKSGLLIDATNVQYYEVTDADLQGYLSARRLPKIEVIDYFGFTQYLDTTDMTVKRKEMEAFDANSVILRYSGMFGEFQWCRVSNIFATSDDPVYYTENGAIAIQEDKAKKGIRFSAESLCAPVPYYIEKVLRLKINEAAE